uniref:Putative secreted protein n=1 Tax=Anopheles darlingi TaxID=43151 RepID=A0A2M4DK38_ANODA
MTYVYALLLSCGRTFSVVMASNIILTNSLDDAQPRPCRIRICSVAILLVRYWFHRNSKCSLVPLRMPSQYTTWRRSGFTLMVGFWKNLSNSLTAASLHSSCP